MTSTDVNPIIPGFSPDPSIVLVDGTFFLVTSTFHMFPGIPVYASKDLISWDHIGNAINRPGQLSLAKSTTKIWGQRKDGGELLASQGGLYAPTIRYHEGTFYILCTNIIHTEDGVNSSTDITENFIITTQDIWSDNWSDPVYFDVGGIDPSIIFKDGKTYIHWSARPGPYTKIKMFEVDVRTGEKLSEERVLWDGAGGIYPEGPHIYERDGYYYLMVSEGGTFEDHMITVARSKDLWGPYTPYEHNPILTARGTDEYVQFTGHCDLFEDLEGRYWGVCLGVRRDSADRYILGRESFLVSATWPKGGWPTFERAKLNPTLPNGEVLRRPEGTVAVKGDARLGYLYIRDPQLEKHKFSDGGKTITLEASQADLSNDGSEPVTFVGRRQQQLSGKSTVTMRKPSAPRAKLKAGLACYKDEHRYARIFYDFETSEVVFEMINVAKSMTKTVRLGYELDESLTLQLDYTESSYQFSFKGSQDTRWKTVAFVDTWNLSGHDFVGPVIGVFATAEKDGVHAQFDGLQVD